MTMSAGMDVDVNQPPIAVEVEVTYKECRHNHAANLGQLAYDGCHEYLKRHDADDVNSEKALLCAACDCHRSYHRRLDMHTLVPQAQAENAVNLPAPVPEVREAKPPRKKRTLFTQEQRSQMTRFADSVGWKPRKANRDEIERFCSEIGITRGLFLVWVSNNRHRATQNNNATPSGTGAGAGAATGTGAGAEAGAGAGTEAGTEAEAEAGAGTDPTTTT